MILGSMFGGLIGLVFEVFGALAIMLVVAFFIFRYLNKGAAQNLTHLARTKAGAAGDKLASIDPAAQMRQAAKDAEAEISSIDDSLVAAEVQRARLERQITSDQRQANKLQHEINSYLDEGRPDNDPEIVSRLSQIKMFENAVVENTAQMKNHEEMFKSLNTNANLISQRIANVYNEANNMQVQLDLGESNMKVLDFMKRYNPSAVNSIFSNINKYKDAGQAKLDEFAARAKVARERNQIQPMTPDVSTEDTKNLLDRIKSQRAGGVSSVTKAE